MKNNKIQIKIDEGPNVERGAILNMINERVTDGETSKPQ